MIFKVFLGPVYYTHRCVIPFFLLPFSVFSTDVKTAGPSSDAGLVVSLKQPKPICFEETFLRYLIWLMDKLCLGNSTQSKLKAAVS